MDPKEKEAKEVIDATSKIVCPGFIDPHSHGDALIGTESGRLFKTPQSITTELADKKEDFSPDYIFVTYGSNDWNYSTKEEFLYNCRTFYDNLKKNYPDIPTFIITPVWRKDQVEERPPGSLESVTDFLKSVAAEEENRHVIFGAQLVLRDVFVNEKPYVLTKHIYAVASISGCGVYLLFRNLLELKAWGILVSVLCTVVIRLLAARFRWKLPKIHLPEEN